MGGYFLPGANKSPAEYRTELLEAQKRRDLLIAENDAATIKIGELTAEHREAFTKDYAKCSALSRQIQGLAVDVDRRRGQVNNIERSLAQLALMASVSTNFRGVK